MKKSIKANAESLINENIMSQNGVKKGKNEILPQTLKSTRAQK
jgi:hypothetical protein